MDTSMVQSILFLLGSVTTVVFDMLQGHMELFKTYFLNPRPSPVLFQPRRQVQHDGARSNGRQRRFGSLRKYYSSFLGEYT